jgi:hypothetical protein
MMIFSKIKKFFKNKKTVVNISIPFCKKTLTNQIAQRKSQYIYLIQRNEYFAYSLPCKDSVVSNVEHHNKLLFEKIYFLEEIRLEELDFTHRLN